MESLVNSMAQHATGGHEAAGIVLAFMLGLLLGAALGWEWRPRY